MSHAAIEFTPDELLHWLDAVNWEMLSKYRDVIMNEENEDEYRDIVRDKLLKKSPYTAEVDAMYCHFFGEPTKKVRMENHVREPNADRMWYELDNGLLVVNECMKLDNGNIDDVFDLTTLPMVYCGHYAWYTHAEWLPILDGLLVRGEDLNIQDEDRYTVLHTCMSFLGYLLYTLETPDVPSDPIMENMEIMLQMIQTLVERGADPLMESKYMDTPLLMAEEEMPWQGPDGSVRTRIMQRVLDIFAPHC